MLSESVSCRLCLLCPLLAPFCAAVLHTASEAQRGQSSPVPAPHAMRVAMVDGTDVNTARCGICLVPLANWPGCDDDWATPNLSLTSLPCGHLFHTDCIAARRVQLQRDERTTHVEPVAVPLVASVCPLCRAPWSVETANEHILGDFESSIELTTESDEEEEGEHGEQGEHGGQGGHGEAGDEERAEYLEAGDEERAEYLEAGDEERAEYLEAGDEERAEYREAAPEEDRCYAPYTDPRTQQVFWATADADEGGMHFGKKAPPGSDTQQRTARTAG